MSADSDEPKSGDIVAEKYRLARLLGRGGMGAVWEGVHVTLGTRVAVKFIEKQYAESKEARARFENEARAAARLTSKHVVKVFDHGVSTNGRPYIVMEFLEGESLEARLERVGRLAPEEAAALLVQVARGLSNAHESGIIHRDLKPENIFLVWDREDRADVAKVVDFGIAKFTDESQGSSSSTRTGHVLGTPYYMSPEQARGLKSIDHRSDLWSLGVIAYRAVIGALPFYGEGMGDLLVKICTDPLPVPTRMASNVPAGFDLWFAKALARDPEQRYLSALEQADELCRALGFSLGSFGKSGASSRSGSGAVPALSAGRDPRAVTAAPLSRTRGSVRPGGVRKGTLALAVAAGMVLMIGIFAALRLTEPEPAEGAATASEHSQSAPLAEARAMQKQDEFAAAGGSFKLHAPQVEALPVPTLVPRKPAASGPGKAPMSTKAARSGPEPSKALPAPKAAQGAQRNSTPEELLGY